MICNQLKELKICVSEMDSSELKISSDDIKTTLEAFSSNRLSNITKLLIHIKPSFSSSLDVLLKKLPNLKYFGCRFPLISNIWIDIEQHNNLEEIELIPDEDPTWYEFSYDEKPLCKFLQMHPNIIRTDYSFMNLLTSELIKNNVSFETMYMHWDYLSPILLFSWSEYWFKKMHNLKLYENLYLQSSYEISEYATEEFFPGIKEVYNIGPYLCPILKRVFYGVRDHRTSKWFNF